MNRIAAGLVAALLVGSNLLGVGIAAASADSSAAPAGSATTTAAISGTVTDDAGTPRAGLHVYAERFDSSGNQLTNQTDSPHAVVAANGTYSIAGIPPGRYRFHFSTEDQEQHTPDNIEPLSWDWGSTSTTPTPPLLQLNSGDVRTDISVRIPGYTTFSGKVSCTNCDIRSIASPSDMRVESQALDSVTGLWSTRLTAGYVYSDYSWRAKINIPGTYRFIVTATFGPIVAPPSASGVVGSGGTFVIDLTVASAVYPVPGVTDRAIQSFLSALYTDYLNRLPGTFETQGWASAIANGLPRSSVAAGFVTSDEYRLIRIDAAYRGILNRDAEPAGRLGWLQAMRGGAITTDDIETTFYASQEYYEQHGNSNTGFMAALYTALLHRQGTASDYAFWSNLIVQHGRPWVIAQFWDSTETISGRVSGMYELYLGRKPEPAGLAGWVGVALQLGDSGLRSALTASEEYFNRAQARFPIAN